LSSPNFYSKLGLFVEPNFFDGRVCSRLRSEAKEAEGFSSRIIEKGHAVIDDNIRRSKSLNVSDNTVAYVKECLLSVKPSIEAYFNFPLEDSENPRFLLYKEGDFFQPHKDNYGHEESSKSIIERKVSVVIFLNSETEKPTRNSYVGGGLTFYKLTNIPPFNTSGFRIIGKKGLLVAFRSNILHEVTPVKYGERYSIASWFFNFRRD
jgi:SM-20-related protein